MVTVKKLLTVWMIELIFLTAIFLGLTCIRVFDSNNFNQIISVYKEYACFDANAALVLEGA